MSKSLVISPSNYSSLSHILPHIRYCAEDRYTSFWVLPERRINDYEFIFGTEGLGLFTLEDRIVELRQGDLLFIRPEVPHSARSITLPFGFLCIHFDVYAPSLRNEVHLVNRWFSESIPASPIKYLKAVLEFPEFSKIEDASYVHVIFKRLVTEAERGQAGFIPMIKACFVELLMNLFRRVDDSYHHTRAYSPDVSTIIEYIKSNYTDRIYLTDLATLVHLQPTYLSCTFKKQTGYSITEFISMCRIAKAKELLLTTGNKLYDIAASTGFYDMHHLIKVFKAYEGITPSQYRQMKTISTGE